MANEPAFPGPYVDVSITKRNVTNDPIVVTPAKRTPNNAMSQDTSYEVEGTDHTPDNDDVIAKPPAPARWLPGRDVYANNGMIGQEFFENS